MVPSVALRANLGLLDISWGRGDKADGELSLQAESLYVDQ